MEIFRKEQNVIADGFKLSPLVFVVKAVAKALAGYDAVEARLIMGCQSNEIEARLGHTGRTAMVHRDDMAM